MAKSRQPSIKSVVIPCTKIDTAVIESQNRDPARYIMKMPTTCRIPKAIQDVTKSIPQGRFEVPAMASFHAMPIRTINKIQHAGISRPKKVARFRKRRTFCFSAVVNGDSNGLSDIRTQAELTVTVTASEYVSTVRSPFCQLVNFD